MAKENIIAEFIKTDVAHEVKLRVYESKQGLSGTLVDKNGNNISSTMLYEKDIDNTIYKVKEYFGFTENNSYCTL